MRKLKEVLSNLKSDKSYYTMLAVVFTLLNFLMISASIILPFMKEERSLEYKNFNETNLGISGKFDSDDIEFLSSSEMSCFSYGNLCVETIELANKEEISLYLSETHNKIDNAYIKAYDSYYEIERVNLIAGRDFIDFDARINSNNIIINEALATILYGSKNDALEKKIKIKDIDYNIIGVINNASSFQMDYAYSKVKYFFCYKLGNNDSIYTDVILDSNNKISKSTVDEINKYFNSNSKSVIYFTYADLLDYLARNTSNTFDVIRYSIYALTTVIYIVFLIILIQNRKTEIALKKNMGATYFDIVSEFIYEFLIIIIIFFITSILPTTLILKIFMDYISSRYFVTYVYSGYLVKYLSVFLFELLLFLICTIVNVFIVYRKNISKVLRE